MYKEVQQVFISISPSDLPLKLRISVYVRRRTDSCVCPRIGSRSSSSGIPSLTPPLTRPALCQSSPRWDMYIGTHPSTLSLTWVVVCPMSTMSPFICEKMPFSWKYLSSLNVHQVDSLDYPSIVVVPAEHEHLLHFKIHATVLLQPQDPPSLLLPGVLVAYLLKLVQTIVSTTSAESLVCSPHLPSNPHGMSSKAGTKYMALCHSKP